MFHWLQERWQFEEKITRIHLYWTCAAVWILNIDPPFSRLLLFCFYNWVLKGFSELTKSTTAESFFLLQKWLFQILCMSVKLFYWIKLLQTQSFHLQEYGQKPKMYVHSTKCLRRLKWSCRMCVCVGFQKYDISCAKQTLAGMTRGCPGFRICLAGLTCKMHFCGKAI